MLKLQSERIYLATLEREDCRRLYREFEYDFDDPAEALNMGFSEENADKWFEEIQNLQGNVNVRLGIFLNSGEIIGDVALQNIDRTNRKCDIGMGINKLSHRCCGYGKEAVHLMLWYAFENLGLNRVEANTLSVNIAAQKSLEQTGFILEGVQRKAVYFRGQYVDRLMYAMLRDDYEKKSGDRNDKRMEKAL